MAEYYFKGMPFRSSKMLFIISSCIVLILVAGCTSPATTTPVTLTSTPTVAPTAAPTAVATTAAPATVATTVQPVTTVTTPTADPILHRWIRAISGTNPKKGYEYKFYPDGTVIYNYGSTKEVSSNLVIQTPADTSASGTWTKLGENKYIVKILPTGTTGAQIVEEYTLVPAHEDPAYPGVIIKDHIESKEETDQINKGQTRLSDEMYYPEKAKID